MQLRVGGLKKASNFSGLDAARLIQECIATLDVHRFPPKLFVLWATPSFAPYKALVSDLREQLNQKGLRDVPLIGASVAACFFDQHVERNGAVLICLASRFMDVRAATVASMRDDPFRAATYLCRELAITEATTPFLENSFLMTFLAGHSAELNPLDYRASEFVDGLKTCIGNEIRLFGGVSSAGLERGAGYQFFNESILQDSAVSAFVTSDLAFECGVHHGLRSTGRRLTVAEVVDGGRVITEFREGAAKDIFATLSPRSVFTYEAADGNRVIVVPRFDHDRFKLLRPIPAGAQLELMEPNARRMTTSVRQLERRALERLKRPRQSLAGLLAVGCVSRYRYAEKIGFDVKAALEKVPARFPGAAHVGCYMDGEIGTSLSGSSELSNWSLSELFLSDEIPATTEFRRGFQALARHAQRRRASETIKDAMERALDCVMLAGYPGCMISLVVQQHREKWVMGWAARGELWKNVILDRTARRLKGGDVLARAVRLKRSELVKDAQKHQASDAKTARAGKVISFYTVPLLDEHGKAFGVLQVDLGDMRYSPGLSKPQRTILDVLGANVANIVGQAILADQFRLVGEFDQLLPECAGKNSLADAIGHFVQGASKALDAGVHVRLHDSKRKSLVLIDGCGDYAAAAAAARKEIPVNSPSPAAKAFRSRQINVVNDVDGDPAIRRLIERSPTAFLRAAASRIRSYCNLPILRAGTACAGTVCIGSLARHYFIPDRLRLLTHIVTRLGLLINHIVQKESQQKTLSKLLFLKAVSPSPAQGLPIYQALRKQIGLMTKIMLADVGSCYLYDEMQRRMVLRAQSGWFSEKNKNVWLDAAWFARNEGVTGFLAEQKAPLYLSDMLEWGAEHKLQSDKWFVAMFGRPLPPNATCDLIALPLWFRKDFLGIITLHRRRFRQARNGTSHFAVNDEEILREVADTCAAHIWALQKADLSNWLAGESVRQKRIATAVAAHCGWDLDSLFNSFCRSIIAAYGFDYCVALSSDGSDQLRARCVASRKDASLVAPSSAEIENDPQVLKVYRHARSNTLRTQEAKDISNPLDVKNELVPNGIVLPVRKGKRLFGVLVFKWRGRRRRSALKTLPHHDEKALSELGNILGSKVGELQDTIRNESRAWQAQHEGAWIPVRAYVHFAKRLLSAIEAGTCSESHPRLPGESRTAPNAKEGPLVSVETLRMQMTELIRELAVPSASTASSNWRPQLVNVRTIVDDLKAELTPVLVCRRTILDIISEGNVSAMANPRALTFLLEELLAAVLANIDPGKHLTIRVHGRTNSGWVELELSGISRSVSSGMLNAIVNGALDIETTSALTCRLAALRELAQKMGAQFPLDSTKDESSLAILLPRAQ